MDGIVTIQADKGIMGGAFCRVVISQPEPFDGLGGQASALRVVRAADRPARLLDEGGEVHHLPGLLWRGGLRGWLR